MTRLQVWIYSEKLKQRAFHFFAQTAKLCQGSFCVFMIDFYFNGCVKTVRSLWLKRFQKRVSGSLDKQMIFFENRTLWYKVQCLLYKIYPL